MAASAACGGRAFDAGEQQPTGGTGNEAGSAPGGSSSSGGTTRGGTSSQGGSSSAGTGQGGSSSAGTGQGGFAGSACNAYDDHPGYSIGVALINKTSATIHLGQDSVTCSLEPLFLVKDANGMPLTFPSSCRASCQSVRNQRPLGCGAACLFPSAVTLAPGEVLYTTWAGLYEVQRQLPGQCLPAVVSDQCRQAVQINPGSFMFSAQAGSTLDCSQTSGGACTACVPDGNGGCTTPASLISGSRHTATTTVRLDASYGVWGAPAPAPVPPGGADAPAGPMATLMVQLVFTD